MAVLAVDLRQRSTRMIFGGLIGFNLIGGTAMIIGWINEKSVEEPSDFSKMV
jgi:hypothetical protein